MSAPSLEEAPDIVQRALARAARAGAAQGDALLVVSDSQETRVRGDEIEFVKQAQERVLGIRVMVSGDGGFSTATTSTSDLSTDAVDRMADETVALARATAPDPHAGLPDEASATKLPNLGLADPADRNVHIEARIEDAKRAEQAARAVDARITNSEGSQAGSDWNRIYYANSRGFAGDYESAYHSLFSEPLACEGESMQRDYWMTVGRRLSDLDDPAEVGRLAAERAVRRLGARRVKTCEVPVIFDALTAPSLLGQIASCVSGYSVYRDVSFLGSKLGEKIAADGVTVVDDGRMAGGLGSKPFDGEGLPTRRNVIIRNGVLESWLLDSYSGRKLGFASTGSASRGAGSGPGVGTTNLSLEPAHGTLNKPAHGTLNKPAHGTLNKPAHGTLNKPAHGTLDDIIASTERGLLVTELIGMGFNPTTGDYSRGASGLWIEDGEIAHPVEEITIASNLGDMLLSIDEIGSELIWRGRTASPPIRISAMTVAGE